MSTLSDRADRAHSVWKELSDEQRNYAIGMLCALAPEQVVEAAMCAEERIEACHS